jgi:hypothetical protein
MSVAICSAHAAQTPGAKPAPGLVNRPFHYTAKSGMGMYEVRSSHYTKMQTASPGRQNANVPGRWNAMNIFTPGSTQLCQQQRHILSRKCIGRHFVRPHSCRRSGHQYYTHTVKPDPDETPLRPKPRTDA